MDELDEVYAAAYADDVFFAEYEGMPAAAGDRRDLQQLAQDSGCTEEEMLADLMASFLGAIIDLCVLAPEKGATRAEGCRMAWEQAKQARERGYFPRMVAVRERLGLPNVDAKTLGTF